MSLIDRLPVLVDLAYEDHRSRVIATVSASRMLLLVFVNLVLQLVGLDVSPSCAEFAGSSSPSAEAASTAFFLLFSLFAALASARENSRRNIAPALLFGLVYFSVLCTLLPSCSQLTQASGGLFSSASVRVALSAVDAIFTIVTLACLGLLALEDPAAAVGRRAAAAEKSVPRLASAFAELHETSQQKTALLGAGSGASAAGGGRGSSGSRSEAWLLDVSRGIAVAPLRHHISVVLSSVFVLAIPIVVTMYGKVFAGVEADLQADETVDGQALIGSLVSVLSDVLFALTVGSWPASIVILVSSVNSYAALYKDVALILSPQPPAASDSSPSENSVGASNESMLSRVMGPSPFVRGDPAGALDVAGPIFSYDSASDYTSLFVVNVLTAFAFVSGLLSGVTFFLSSRITRSAAIYSIAALVFSALYAYLVRVAYRRWVVSGVKVLRPRLFVFLDFFLSTSAGAAAGFSAGVVRFVFGTLHVLYRMTVLSRPILPDAFAAYDSGFVAYGSMIRAALAAELAASANASAGAGVGAGGAGSGVGSEAGVGATPQPNLYV